MNSSDRDERHRSNRRMDGHSRGRYRQGRREDRDRSRSRNRSRSPRRPRRSQERRVHRHSVSPGRQDSRKSLEVRNNQQSEGKRRNRGTRDPIPRNRDRQRDSEDRPRGESRATKSFEDANGRNYTARMTDEDTVNSRQQYDAERVARRELTRPNESDPEPSTAKESWGSESAGEESSKKPREEANFEQSGLLFSEANTFKGVVIQHVEPAEARKPKLRWRLYPFKDNELLHIVYIHRQSAYLIGRDNNVCDIVLLHPSVSKQHAGQKMGKRTTNVIKPYLMDLGSTNKTHLNGQPLDPRRYYELKEQDAIKFGFSSREYILLHENSAGTGSSGKPGNAIDDASNEDVEIEEN